ncbi:hypothetical protein ACU4GD_43655 [Cupriavidus basilensis]
MTPDAFGQPASGDELEHGQTRDPGQWPRCEARSAVSGAKNAALPILCAGLLTADTAALDNVPNLQDVRTTL